MSDQQAAPGAPERPRSALAEFRKNPVVDLVITVAMAIAIAYAVQLWIVKPYRVPSQSMEQTLHVGDRILAARFLYHFTDPSRGDIIVFHPNGRGDDVFQTDHASSQNYVKRLIGLPNEWVGSSNGKVYVCETQAPASKLQPDEHAGLPLPEGVVHDVPDRSVQQYDGRFRATPPGQGSVPDAGRQPAVLRGLALLGRDPPLADHRARVRDLLAARPASRACSLGACLTRSPPRGTCTTPWRQSSTLLLADLGRWVAHDSPSGAVPELDLLAGDIARTLTGYGLAAELVPSPAGLHVHAVLEGAGRGARRAALPPRHRLPARHRRAASAAARRRPPARARDGRHEGRHRGGGACRSRARGGRAAVRPARARERARRGGALGADRDPGAPRGFDAVLCMECGRPGGAVVAARKGGRWLDIVARGRSAHAGSEPEHGRNAVLALARELPRIAAIDRAREGLTLHVTRMHGGDVLNSIPGEARATIDMRAWHEADLDWAEAQLLRCDQHRGIRFSADEERLVTPPLERTPAVAALAGQAAAIGAALGSPVPETSTGGVSDGCWTAGAGIPTLDGLARSAHSTIRPTSTSRSPRSLPAAGSSRGSWRQSTPACCAPGWRKHSVSGGCRHEGSIVGRVIAMDEQRFFADRVTARSPSGCALSSEPAGSERERIGRLARPRSLGRSSHRGLLGAPPCSPPRVSRASRAAADGRALPLGRPAAASAVAGLVRGLQWRRSGR